MSRTQRLVALALVATGLATAGLVARTAHAETLYHCRDRHGVSVYQDAPCTGDLRAIDSRSFARAAIDPALAAQTEAARQSLERRAIESLRAARLSGVRQRRLAHAADDPCKAAKGRRDATLKRVGLRRTYDQLSQLDGDVWDACKGF